MKSILKNEKMNSNYKGILESEIKKSSSAISGAAFRIVLCIRKNLDFHHCTQILEHF